MMDNYQTRMYAELSPDARRLFHALAGLMTPDEWRPIVLLDAAVHRLPPAEPRPGPVPDGMDPRRAAYSGVTLVTILCQSYGNSGVHASRRTRV